MIGCVAKVEEIYWIANRFILRRLWRRDVTKILNEVTHGIIASFCNSPKSRGNYTSLTHQRPGDRRRPVTLMGCPRSGIIFQAFPGEIQRFV
jgi:hypothetical protein